MMFLMLVLDAYANQGIVLVDITNNKFVLFSKIDLLQVPIATSLLAAFRVEIFVDLFYLPGKN